MMIDERTGMKIRTPGERRAAMCRHTSALRAAEERKAKAVDVFLAECRSVMGDNPLDNGYDVSDELLALLAADDALRALREKEAGR